MGERINIVDRYDLTVLRDEIDRDLSKLKENEIGSVKSSLQLQRKQINGIGDVLVELGDEVEKLKNIVNTINKDHTTDILGQIDYNLRQADMIGEIKEELNNLINDYNKTKRFNKYLFFLNGYFLGVGLLYFILHRA